MARRGFVVALGGTIVLATLSCGSPPRPPEHEVYSLALEAVRAELDLPTPVLVHPLPVQIIREDGGEFRLGTFNAYDSLPVPSAVERDPAAFELCVPSEAGFCNPGPDRASVVLSEIQELGADAVGVLLIVEHARPQARYQRYFNARLKAGARSWSVVALTPSAAE